MMYLIFTLITVYFAVNSFMAGSYFNDFHEPGGNVKSQYFFTAIAILFGIPILIFELVSDLKNKDKGLVFLGILLGMACVAVGYLIGWNNEDKGGILSLCAIPFFLATILYILWPTRKKGK